jgi:hypothetical protein
MNGLSSIQNVASMSPDFLHGKPLLAADNINSASMGWVSAQVG